MRRQTTLLAALTLAAGSLTLNSTPAFAATPAIANVDASVAGHVTGTVTTDAPGVVISVKDADNAASIDALTVRDNTGGPIDFDLSTWGHRDRHGPRLHLRCGGHRLRRRAGPRDVHRD